MRVKEKFANYKSSWFFNYLYHFPLELNFLFVIKGT